MENKEKEELPALRLKDIPLSFPGEENKDKTVKIKLDCPKAVKTGEGRYGVWHLWFGYGDNVKVSWGRGKDARNQDDYTGKFLFFPTDILNDTLEKLTEGNTNVEILLKKTVEEGKSGQLIKKYEVKKLSDGSSSETSLTPSEINLINDAKDLKSKGYDLTVDDFITASKDEKYGSQINDERAKKLYAYI